MSEAQLYAYERFWDEVNRNQVLNEANYQKGIDVGRDERTIEIARNLKAINLPIEQIVTATGLSADEIAAL